MKSNLILLVSVAVLGVNTSYAQDAFSSCSHGKENLASVICYGPAVLKETTVRGNIKVVGPLTARKVIAHSLQVTGTADLQDMQVAEAVEITGYLQAYDSHFYKGLTIQADNALLNHTIVGGDVEMNSSATKPYFRVQCGSSVNGNITFGGV